MYVVRERVLRIPSSESGSKRDGQQRKKERTMQREGRQDFECGRHDLREETVGRKQRESASLLIGQSKRKSQVHNNLRIPEIQDSSELLE